MALHRSVHRLNLEHGNNGNNGGLCSITKRLLGILYILSFLCNTLKAILFQVDRNIEKFKFVEANLTMESGIMVIWLYYAFYM